MAAAGFSYIQVIYCLVIQHWLTIKISFDENVRIFDSLFLNEVSFRVKKHHEAAYVSCTHINIDYSQFI